MPIVRSWNHKHFLSLSWEKGGGGGEKKTAVALQSKTEGSKRRRKKNGQGNMHINCLPLPSSPAPASPSLTLLFFTRRFPHMEEEEEKHEQKNSHIFFLLPLGMAQLSAPFAVGSLHWGLYWGSGRGWNGNTLWQLPRNNNGDGGI